MTMRMMACSAAPALAAGQAEAAAELPGMCELARHPGSAGKVRWRVASSYSTDFLLLVLLPVLCCRRPASPRLPVHRVLSRHRPSGSAQSSTRIKFVTDGVLLREMMDDPLLTRYR
jgi:hypothetical protein